MLVTEDAIREAFRFMYGRMKLACEAAGAATAAALLSGTSSPSRARPWPQSSRAATSLPKRPLLSWPRDEA